MIHAGMPRSVAFRAMRRALRAVSGDGAGLDARVLLRHALGDPADAAYAHDDRILTDAESETAQRLLDRRLAHEPVAYITGRRAFWTLDLEVGAGVLIPRPDSETLVDAALKATSRDDPIRAVDFGVGSGALLLAFLSERPRAFGLGIDLSDAALRFARRNARTNGLGTRCALIRGDWDESLARGIFDVAFANPPYLAAGDILPPDVGRFEPHEALFSGADGLDAHRHLARAISGVLKPGGVFVAEIGADQAQAATAIYRGAPFDELALLRDLSGHARALTGRRRKPESPPEIV